MVELRHGDDTLTLSWDEWEIRVREGRIQPTTLVRFEPATGEAFVPAGELEMFQSLQDDAAVTAWQTRFLKTAPLLTAVIVGIQIRLWWGAQWSKGVYDLATDHMTVFAPSIYENREVWRVLTMGITQVDILHLSMNMLWLFYCGWNLERALGRVNLGVLYLGAVVAARWRRCSVGPTPRPWGPRVACSGWCRHRSCSASSAPTCCPRRAADCSAGRCSPTCS